MKLPRLQFGTRGLLILVAMFCCLAVYLKTRFVDQMLAHDAVIRLGGGLGFDRDDGGFPDVTRVHLAHTDVGDSELRILGKLPYLRDLHINDTRVTDDGLRSLAELTPRLAFLDARGTAITEEAIEELRRGLTDCTIITDLTPASIQAEIPRAYKCPRCGLLYTGSDKCLACRTP